MTAEFAPIILVIFFWIFVSIPVSIAKKAAQQKKSFRPAPPPTPAPAGRTGAEKPEKKQEAAAPERLTTLVPGVSPSGHDDSVYRGSLDADTGEGYDPCHDEQMESLAQAAEEDFAPRPAPARAGIPLGWTNNDVVRGIVMSEILNRKKN